MKIDFNCVRFQPKKFSWSLFLERDLVSTSSSQTSQLYLRLWVSVRSALSSQHFSFGFRKTLYWFATHWVCVYISHKDVHNFKEIRTQATKYAPTELKYVICYVTNFERHVQWKVSLLSCWSSTTFFSGLFCPSCEQYSLMTSQIWLVLCKRWGVVLCRKISIDKNDF